MKTLVVTPHNQDDIDKLIELLNKSDLVDDVRVEDEDKPSLKKLTSKDIALGIGRPATDEELMEYLTRPRKGKPKPLENVISDIKEKLKEGGKKKAS